MNHECYVEYVQSKNLNLGGAYNIIFLFVAMT